MGVVAATAPLASVTEGLGILLYAGLVVAAVLLASRWAADALRADPKPGVTGDESAPPVRSKPKSA